jgi:hypothetical protein
MPGLKSRASTLDFGIGVDGRVWADGPPGHDEMKPVSV